MSNAEKLFRKIGNLEEAFETIYNKVDEETVLVTYKYSDDKKTIYITTKWITGIAFEGRFDLQNWDLIKEAIDTQIKELEEGVINK